LWHMEDTQITCIYILHASLLGRSLGVIDLFKPLSVVNTLAFFGGRGIVSTSYCNMTVLLPMYSSAFAM
jgi:hypothetical protein